jgi:hypothetical protein
VDDEVEVGDEVDEDEVVQVIQVVLDHKHETK